MNLFFAITMTTGVFADSTRENTYLINMKHICNSAKQPNFLDQLSRGSALVELQNELMKKKKQKLWIYHKKWVNFTTN